MEAIFIGRTSDEALIENTYSQEQIIVYLIFKLESQSIPFLQVYL